MALRDAARAAYEASLNDKTDDARQLLLDTLGDPEGYVTGLTIADTRVIDGVTLIVFTDGDIHLGVRFRQDATGGEIWLVEASGGWQFLGEPVTSLEHLGRLLPALDPPEGSEPDPDEPAVWVQPTGAHDAYPLGAQVTYNGKVWESTVDGNVWKPGEYGWTEVV